MIKRISNTFNYFTKTDYITDNSHYKNSVSYNDRIIESEQILNRFIHSVPVIIESEYSNIEFEPINAILDKDINIFNLIVFIKEKIKTRKIIYIFTETGKCLSINDTLNDIYDKYKNKDKFLYLKVSDLKQ